MATYSLLHSLIIDQSLSVASNGVVAFQGHIDRQHVAQQAQDEQQALLLYRPNATSLQSLQHALHCATAYREPSVLQPACKATSASDTSACTVVCEDETKPALQVLSHNDKYYQLAVTRLSGSGLLEITVPASRSDIAKV
jgi:hypothetical protein